MNAGRPIYDAHNHLQDPRLEPHRESIWAAWKEMGLRRAVVNGTREDDWAVVLKLAENHPSVLPSLGLHPWHVPKRSPEWKARLEALLDERPCAVGEIGLDRWIAGWDAAEQEEVFVAQLGMAATRGLPVTIHCLRAWGRMLEILQAEFSGRGFLLHSYGGPAEMVESFAGLGAYFSISGAFFHDRKAGKREVFKCVPRERLLIETDAPDMALPENLNRFPLSPCDGKQLNHPGNILAIYTQTAELLGIPPDDLDRLVAANFGRLFESVLSRPVLNQPSN